MKQTPSTNQPFSGASDPQEIELENDPELAAIVTHLQVNASYAINPEFKDELHKELLQQFRGYHTKETD